MEIWIIRAYYAEYFYLLHIHSFDSDILKKNEKYKKKDFIQKFVRWKGQTKWIKKS